MSNRLTDTFKMLNKHHYNQCVHCDYFQGLRLTRVENHLVDIYLDIVKCTKFHKSLMVSKKAARHKINKQCQEA